MTYRGKSVLRKKKKKKHLMTDYAEQPIMYHVILESSMRNVISKK